jgi:putative transposase
MDADPLPHRKRIKHYEQPSDVRELTFSCYRRWPLLTNDLWRAMLSESLEQALPRHHFKLVAFVFMPEHVHLIVYPTNNASGVDELLKAITRPFSSRIKQLLEKEGSSLLNRLTVRHGQVSRRFGFGRKGPVTIGI